MNKLIAFVRKNKESIILISILALAAIKIFNYVLLYPELSPNGAPEEFIIDYTAGKNFAIKGFTKLFFLADYSTDFQKDSPPIFATHTPSLSMIFNGLMIKLGLNVLQIRITYAFVALFGVLFVFLFVRRISNILAATISSFFLIFNYSGYIFWADHQVYSFYYTLFFGYLWARYTFPKKKYVIVPLIFLFTSLFSHIIWGYLLAAEIILYFFEKDKKLLLLSFLLSGVGILSHLIRIILALGIETAWYDFLFTLLNRVISYPPKEILISLYQEHNLVLWGSSSFKASFIDYLFNLARPFRQLGVQLFLGVIALFLLSIFRLGSSYKNLKIIITIFLAGFFWHIFFPAMAQNYGIPFGLTSFLIVFLGLVLADLAVVSYKIWFKKIPFFRNNIEATFLLVVLISLSGLSIAGQYFISFSYFGTDRDFLVEMEILKNYRGKTFFTNIFPTNVAFATKTWAVGSCSPRGLINLDTSWCQSKFVVKKEALVPDYILISPRYSPFPCAEDCLKKLKEDLDSKYNLVEKINDGKSLIYKVGKN